ncbi:MAG: porin [Chitinophagaceae bacterium]
MKNLITIAILAFLVSNTVEAQKQGTYTKASFGKGIGFASSDSSFTLALSGRIQSMAEVKHELNDEKTTADFFVRRCRLNIQGTAFDPRFTYRIQIGFAQRDITADNTAAQNNLIMRDAMLYYAPYKWLKFGFGQTKLPGNRQRQVSSANLQLVERSIANNNFTLDRDKGIWMFNNFKFGKSILKSTLAISSGDGRINSDKNGELCYSGRAEFLPFGEFAGNGDYIEASQEREQKLKLSIAGVYSFNSAASRTMGQLGEYLYNNQHANLTYYGGDLMLKYKGYSLEMELYNRETDRGIITNSKDSTLKNYIISGRTLMIQSGIFISKRSEIAVRYARIDPSQKIITLFKTQEEYVLGYSRYFFKHNLKIQTDCSYMKNGSKESVIYRLSGVVSF